MERWIEQEIGEGQPHNFIAMSKTEYLLLDRHGGYARAEFQPPMLFLFACP